MPSRHHISQVIDWTTGERAGAAIEPRLGDPVGAGADDAMIAETEILGPAEEIVVRTDAADQAGTGVTRQTDEEVTVMIAGTVRRAVVIEVVTE